MPSRVLYERILDPISMLFKLSGSLRTLRIDGLFCVGGVIRVYPVVEALQVVGHEHGMLDLKTYLTCFPNLRHLQCGNPGAIRMRYKRTADLFKEECRLTTVQQWHDYNKRSVSGQPHSWSTLQSFRGCVVDAYVLSLPCHVEHMHLLSTGGKLSVEHGMLLTILSDARPTSLRLCLKVYEGRGYIPILPPPHLWAQSLTRLEVRINIVKQYFDVDECVVRHVA